MTGKSSLVRAVALMLVLLVAALLRLYGARSTSLWQDEVLCVYNADRPFPETLSILKHENQPPGYHFILHYWMQFFGRSHLALRSLSILSGMVLLLIVFQLSRDLFGESTAWWALLIATFSAALLEFAQEVTPYALYLVLCVGGSLAFVRLWMNERSWLLWVLYVILRAATIYVHYFGLFFLCAEGLWVILHVRSRWSFLLKWIGVQVAVVALFAPWIPTFLEQRQRVAEGGFWVRPLQILDPANALRQWALWVPELDHTPWNAIIPAAAGVYLLLLAFVFFAMVYRFFQPIEIEEEEGKPFHDGASGPALAFLYFLVPIGVVLGLSLTGSSLFTPKYLLASAVFCYLLVGHGIARLRPRFLGWLAGIVLLVLSGAACYLNLTHPGYQNPEYNKAAAAIRQGWDESDIIVTQDSQSFSVLHHYLQDVDPTVLWWLTPGQQVPFWQGLEGFPKEMFTTDIDSYLERLPRVWIAAPLSNRKPWEDDWGGSFWEGAIEPRFAGRGYEVSFQREYAGVEVVRLTPTNEVVRRTSSAE